MILPYGGRSHGSHSIRQRTTQGKSVNWFYTPHTNILHSSNIRKSKCLWLMYWAKESLSLQDELWKTFCLLQRHYFSILLALQVPAPVLTITTRFTQVPWHFSKATTFSSYALIYSLYIWVTGALKPCCVLLILGKVTPWLCIISTILIQELDPKNILKIRWQWDLLSHPRLVIQLCDGCLLYGKVSTTDRMTL